MSDDQSQPETLWQAFMRWVWPQRVIEAGALRGIERIAEARQQESRELWADPRIQRRIIEGRGLSSGKLYGYVGNGQHNATGVRVSHVVRGSFTREVSR